MDSYTYSKAVANTVLAEGGDTWFFITVDYAGGHAIEAAMSESVKRGGGKVLGTARHPSGSHDFASYLVTAQSSGAKVVGLANAGRLWCKLAGTSKRSLLRRADFKPPAPRSRLQAQLGRERPDAAVRTVPCGCDASARCRRS